MCILSYIIIRLLSVPDDVTLLQVMSCLSLLIIFIFLVDNFISPSGIFTLAAAAAFCQITERKLTILYSFISFIHLFCH